MHQRDYSQVFLKELVSTHTSEGFMYTLPASENATPPVLFLLLFHKSIKVG